MQPKIKAYRVLTSKARSLPLSSTTQTPSPWKQTCTLKVDSYITKTMAKFGTCSTGTGLGWITSLVLI